ncbi:hypothetical protein BKA66DRAFT_434250 [Pyrenochaeta sp. MPI-SDFR-AT-0127]|nr:hypothetical protein BKA66DRAFT_434250 [Pyrenochaeta sp. MPI-SDFR-AT-0127]
MAEAERPGGVQGDLERELTCSICTDLLFQPLTLLDCLHTFCGACLKEWFAFQASTAASIHPYTCPACRASVRTTQPNATVTTLLEIFLKANPERGKSEDEKQADRDKFTPGDNVLPKLRRRDERDEAERRMLEEMQQLSLREAGIASGQSASLELPQEHPRRERSRDRSRELRTSRDERRARSRNPSGASPSRAAMPARAVEHQSSLRSLLSASELDSEDIDEDLVRQVLEELVAEGVDLNQIGVAQEEEITERIAEAVRRRQAERQAERQRERRERRGRMARDDRTSPSSAVMPSPVRRAQGRAEGGTPTPQTATRPPVSRPGLIDAANRGRHSHPRSSSQSSSQSGRRNNADADTPAPVSAPAPRRRQSDSQQRSRLDARQQFRNSLHSTSSSTMAGPAVPTQSASTPASTPFQPPSSRRTIDSNGAVVSATTVPRSTIDAPVYQVQASQPQSRETYPEPHMSCQQCAKDHIEYELHYTCTRCLGGDYNICIRCYRSGKGCNHWFGFGWTAWPLYERQAPEGGYPPHHEHPHILVGNRYRSPLAPLTESLSAPHVLISSEDPGHRLESGVFCDMCKAYTNACYWKCDYCNQGDWGFCNDCVNQGRHCTHPLLPVAQKASEEAPTDLTTPSAASPPRPDAGLAPPNHDMASATPPLTPKSASLVRGPAHLTIAHSIYRPLTFTTLCNICTYPIPPSHTRYHCLKCNAGDYDICTSCYHKLNVSGRISKEDGSNGWRKCLRGHRMVLVGFEDRDGGQRRIVVRDLVGGHALKEEQDTNARLSSQRYPPDGGVGLRLLATWQYWPDEGVQDELAFPRGAEIREAAAINEDWYWGVYCGAKGLFPANHVTTV